MSQKIKTEATSQNITETFEEELASIKEKGKDLKGDSRDFYSSIVQRLENNVQVLADLREEHTNLRKQLSELVKKKKGNHIDTDIDMEVKHLTHRINLLKKQIDNNKHKKQEAIARQTELQVELSNFSTTTENEKIDNNDICDLKNRLDNCNIKLSETNHLMKIYGQVLYMMERQKMHWNRILEGYHKEIQQKQRDISDLVLIARDSKHSKDTATNEFIRTQKSSSEAREKREVTLNHKKSQLHPNIHRAQVDNDQDEGKQVKQQQSLNAQPSVLRNRINRAQREKKEDKFRSVSSTIDDIREYFGTIEPEIISQFFKERNSTMNTLSGQISEIKEECSQLENQARMIKNEIEEAEYTSSKGIGSKRLLSEGNRILKLRNEELQKKNRELESVKNHQRLVLNGINHISDLMSLIQKDEDTATSVQTPIGFLNWATQKLAIIKKAMSEEETDYVSLCNVQVLQSIIAKSASVFDIKQVDSSKRVSKRTVDPLKRPAKENKGEIVTRVLNRQAIKNMAQKAATQQANQPKKVKA